MKTKRVLLETGGGYFAFTFRASNFFTIVAFLMTLAQVRVSKADTLTYLGTEAGTGDCAGDCCQKFEWTLSPTPSGIEIHDLVIDLNANTPFDTCTCLSTTCFLNQSVGGNALGRHVSTGLNCLQWQAHAQTSETLDVTVIFTICGTNDCWKQFPSFNWTSDNGYYGADDVGLSLCTDGYPACYEGCPWVTANDDGCYTDVIFHNDQTACLSTIVLQFNPGLSNCNRGNGLTGGGTPLCSSCTTITLHPQNGGAGWTQSYNPSDSELTLTNPYGINCLPICDLMHIHIPKCTTSENQTITVDPVNDPCDEWFNITMKQGSTKVDRMPNNQSQNYPNPLDARTGFKTTIPFETDAKGIATITVTNEAGQQIIAESMEATYVGQHFFYFSGERLPAGKYFYQIQFPQGVVIVNRTMVIVK